MQFISPQHRDRRRGRMPGAGACSHIAWPVKRLESSRVSNSGCSVPLIGSAEGKNGLTARDLLRVAQERIHLLPYENARQSPRRTGETWLTFSHAYRNYVGDARAQTVRYLSVVSWFAKDLYLGSASAAPARGRSSSRSRYAGESKQIEPGFGLC